MAPFPLRSRRGAPSAVARPVALAVSLTVALTVALALTAAVPAGAAAPARAVVLDTSPTDPAPTDPGSPTNPPPVTPTSPPPTSPTSPPSSSPTSPPSSSPTSPTSPTTAPARTTPALRPVPATRTHKARNVPLVPPDGLRGRRIVYSKALMTVWIVGADNRVVRRFPVVGRPDRPAAGSHRIYSKSPASMNVHSRVTFRWMVRFAYGSRTGAAIGFHDIPRFYAGARAGQRMHPTSSLGLPIATGGCVRQADADALFLYRWSRVGDRVVVLAT